MKNAYTKIIKTSYRITETDEFKKPADLHENSSCLVSGSITIEKLLRLLLLLSTEFAKTPIGINIPNKNNVKFIVAIAGLKRNL